MDTPILDPPEGFPRIEAPLKRANQIFEAASTEGKKKLAGFLA